MFNRRTDIRIGCWGSDINAGCGGRDITVTLGAHVYTLIVSVVTSTLGMGAGQLLWLWGDRYTHWLLGQ